jgi:predicted nucleic acid-binding protein
MATKAVIFDSNVWIGYFNIDDTTHTKAVNYFKKHSQGTVVLTEYVLLEIATVLKQKIGPVQTHKIITTILQTESIELLPSSEYFDATLAQFLTMKDTHLSFVDVSLVVLSVDFKVITFDKKLVSKIKN